MLREIDAQAKRAVVLRWGDFASSRPVIDALARGQLDHWILRPEYPADEEFHRSIAELLDDVGGITTPALRGGTDHR